MNLSKIEILHNSSKPTNCFTTNPKKILIITPYFYPAYCYGGPIESIYHLGKEWARAGCRVEVLSTNANCKKYLNLNKKNKIPLDGMMVTYFPCNLKSSFSLALLINLYGNIKKSDFIYLNFTYSFTTIPSFIISRVLGKKIIWSPHGALSDWSLGKKKTLKKIWIKILNSIISSDTILHFTSKEEYEFGVKKMPNAKSIIVPFGIDVPPLSKKETSETIRFIYIGRIDPIKNLENLLGAFSIVSTDNVRLEIYGGGEASYVKKISELVKDLGLEEKVKIKGEVEHSKLEVIFNSADMLILPSYIENFGMVVLEALSYSVPVIVSSGTPWKDAEKRGYGIIVENSKEKIAEAIKRASSLDLPEMGKIGRTMVLKEYAWTDISKRFLKSLFS